MFFLPITYYLTSALVETRSFAKVKKQSFSETFVSIFVTFPLSPFPDFSKERIIINLVYSLQSTLPKFELLLWLHPEREIVPNLPQTLAKFPSLDGYG